MYVSVDKITQELALELPVALSDYYNELKESLMEEFAFEAMNKDTVKQMNVYVINWFASKGIELNENQDEDETN